MSALGLRNVASVICFIVVPAVPAVAHHSFGAEYDSDKPVTITGVITRIDWTNPHSYVFLDAKDSDGTITSWAFEGYPPSVLYRTGWKKDSMHVGDTITVFGWRARDRKDQAHGREATLADGKKLYFGPPAGTGAGPDSPTDEPAVSK